MAVKAAYSYEISRNIAYAVIVANSRLADATRVPADELMHDLATEMWRSYESYDPSKSQYITWASGVGRRRLIDRLRRVSRHYCRPVARSRVPGAEEGEGGMSGARGSGGGGGEHVGEVPLEDHPELVGRSFVFFSSACPEIVQNIPRRLGADPRGRLGHPPRAYAAAIAYRESKALSWSALSREMASSGELLREMGFSSMPCRTSLIDSRRRLWAWAKRTR